MQGREKEGQGKEGQDGKKKGATKRKRIGLERKLDDRKAICCTAINLIEVGPRLASLGLKMPQFAF